MTESTAQVDGLLGALDRLKLAAEAEATKLGLPDGPIATFFQKPFTRAEWLLLLAHQGKDRNPQALNFLRARMPEPAIPTRGARHEGTNAAKGARAKGGA